MLLFVVVSKIQFYEIQIDIVIGYRRFRAKHSSDTICEWVAIGVVAMATV